MLSLWVEAIQIESIVIVRKSVLNLECHRNLVYVINTFYPVFFKSQMQIIVRVSKTICNNLDLNI